MLETRNGQRLTVELPWLFAPRGAFGLGQWPLSESTAEVTAECQASSDGTPAAWTSAVAWVMRTSSNSGMWGTMARMS